MPQNGYRTHPSPSPLPDNLLDKAPVSDFWPAGSPDGLRIARILILLAGGMQKLYRNLQNLGDIGENTLQKPLLLESARQA